MWPIIWPVALVAVAAAVVGGVVRGGPGVLGALLAGVVIIAFLGSTPVVLNPIASSNPTLSLPVAVLFFMIKAFAAMAVLLLLFDVGGVAENVDRQVFGLTAAVCALVWTGLQALAFKRARVLTYDLNNDSQ